MLITSLCNFRYHSTADVWDDGVIDPRDTRKTLAMALAACNVAFSYLRPYWAVFSLSAQATDVAFWLAAEVSQSCCALSARDVLLATHVRLLGGLCGALEAAAAVLMRRGAAAVKAAEAVVEEVLGAAAARWASSRRMRALRRRQLAADAWLHAGL